ncbi:hypothetical protein BD769DRAFT_1389301 [Suillus cothurnatus]|nr:hypothetical protein BD769DRAFT_1389301 [Suillus cothurnatus]
MVMPLCGKVRICHRGDSIRTVFAIHRLTESYRDNTFVWAMVVSRRSYFAPWMAGLYGGLTEIPSTYLQSLPPVIQILVEYEKFLPIIVTDLRNIKAAVGRVNTRRRWGIIDRTINAACASFADVDEEYNEDYISDEEM